MDRLRAEHPKLVVVSVFRGYLATHSNGFLSGFSSYDPAWINSLTRLVQQLRGTGAKVLVLGPLPALNTSVPGCLSEHLDDATACSPPMSFAFNRPGIAAESAAVKAGGGQYAELTDLFCTANRCPVIVGNTLVYVDAGHLTIEYSRLLAPAMAARGGDRGRAAGLHGIRRLDIHGFTTPPVSPRLIKALKARHPLAREGATVGILDARLFSLQMCRLQGADRRFQVRGSSLRVLRLAFLPALSLRRPPGTAPAVSLWPRRSAVACGHGGQFCRAVKSVSTSTPRRSPPASARR